MALDVLPGTIGVKTRDEWIAAYKRSYKLRDPDASTDEGTQPHIDATSIADQLAILSENARQIGRLIPLSEVTGSRLDQRAAELGMPPRFPDIGSSGFVAAQTAAGGSTIESGDELTDADSNELRFQCTRTATYFNGDPVPIAAISVGPQTNLDAGTLLQWSAPRPGCSPNALVVEQTDGSGLSGGRVAESDDELRQRISDTLANPAAAGNDAAYQRLVENSQGHGVAVQKAFTFAAASGAGTIGVAFTLKPATVGGSRVPNAALIDTVRDYVVGLLPGDDQYLEVALVAQPLSITLDVQWATGAADWVDAIRWPVRAAAGAGAIVVTAATSATDFTLGRDIGGSYTGVPAPVAGQNVGFYDRAAQVFRRKRIGTVVGAGPWSITVDTANAASDTSYTPVVGQRACPWSDSLDLLVAPIVSFFGTFGPGEQQATFFDPGVRQRRNPPSPKTWPSVVSNRLAGDILKEPPIQDAIVREGLGTVATIGTPGATAYLIELEFIAAFPL